MLLIKGRVKGLTVQLRCDSYIGWCLPERCMLSLIAKIPSVQYSDGEAHRMVEEFIATNKQDE